MTGKRWAAVWLPDDAFAEWDTAARAWRPVIRYRLHEATRTTELRRQPDTYMNKTAALSRAQLLARKSLFGDTHD